MSQICINSIALISLTIFNSLVAVPIVEAQHLFVDADQIHALLKSGTNIVLVDARNPDEYREGHIPGAINIQPDSLKVSRAGLPKDKSAQVIFYCRGIG